MGWFTDDAPDHEGYPVALLECGDGNYLEPRRDGLRFTTNTLQAGCDCGWRSERICATQPVTWDAGYVDAGERERARLERLWSEHVEVMLYRRRRAMMLGSAGDERTRSVFGRQLLSALDGLDRCRCGHLRAHHRATDATACTYKDSIGHCTCEAFRFMPSPA
jgi:hypothetical protein